MAKKSNKSKIPKLKFLPPEKRYVYAANMLWNTWVNLPNILGQQIGWEKANEFIKGIAYKDAFNDAPAGLKNQGVKKKDATGAMLAALDLIPNTFPEAKYKIVEATPKRCIAEYYACPQCDYAEKHGLLDRKKKTRKIDYPGIDEIWFSHVAELVNPRLKVKFDSSLCKGDDKTRLTIYEE